MRPPLLICLIVSTFLVGCVYEGTIVEKHTNPLPLHHSVGVDGSYSFILRDQAGTTHRQIVTPEVFERYTLGDYFNDLQPVPAGKDYPKAIQSAAATPTANRLVARKTIASKPAVAKVKKKATKSKRITVQKQKARKKHLALRNKRRAPVTKVARPQQVAQTAQIREADMLLVSVVRCR
ncbi:MAG: hypothetical protein ABIR71_09285 [Chthoniobacterales bacterium]